MTAYTLTYRRRGTTLLLHAKVFCDSLTGAETALLMWEGDIEIISTESEV